MGAKTYDVDLSHSWRKIAINGTEMRKQIEAGARRLEVKFLSKSTDGALRFPTARRLVK